MLNNKGEEVGIIYGWYCTITDKWYVGQTVNQERRFKGHIDAAINKKDNTKFHNALRKYGLENFVYCVLESNVLRENLNLKEQEWIEYYDSFYNGYNLTAGGGQTIFSEETRQKLSYKLKGRTFSMETRNKMSKSNKGRAPWNKGKISIYSDETKKRISESLKGNTPWNKGKHWCKEIKEKMSKSHKGKPASNRKKVLKYDLNGNYIQTYNSASEAMEQNTKCGAISAVCRGERKQAGGFIWKYAS